MTYIPKGTKRKAVSYLKRVEDINKIHSHFAKQGLSTREIWRRHIYPQYAISERTLYAILKAEYKTQQNQNWQEYKQITQQQ